MKLKASSQSLNWFIFFMLCLIWGSSFILMKEGLKELTAIQVASLRIVSAGFALLPVVIKNIRVLPGKKRVTVFFSGVLGSLIPAYLFCIAETQIDSSTAGVLNALTPVFALIIGAVFFSSKVLPVKIVGMIIAFGGSILLYVLHPNTAGGAHVFSILLVVLATVCYGINLNLVPKYLHAIPSVTIAAFALVMCVIPAGVVLVWSGFFKKDMHAIPVQWSIFYTCVLGVVGTAVASVIFYMLIKRSGAVFASMVTYGIPIVAFGWGLLYGEEVGWKEALSMIIILAGVYLTSNNAQRLMDRK